MIAKNKIKYFQVAVVLIIYALYCGRIDQNVEEIFSVFIASGLLHLGRSDGVFGSMICVGTISRFSFGTTCRVSSKNHSHPERLHYFQS